jgi:hypothetical protein
MYQNMLMRSLSLYHTFTSYFSYVRQYLFHRYEHVKQWFYNYNHISWVFLPGHSLPLPLSVISNQPTYEWKYDTQKNQFMYQTQKPLISCKLSILSAKLLVKQHERVQEYDLDSFLETFQVYTDGEHVPTLKMIIMAWCAHHKLWFPATYAMNIEYIDHLGNMLIANLSQEHNITIQQNKLYITCPSPVPSTYQEVFPVIRPLMSLLS